MKRTTFYGILLLIGMAPGLVLGQLRSDAQPNISKALTKPSGVKGLVGLIGLDPSKFSMQHSYTLSFATAGGQTFNQGLYLNTMQYRISNPLTTYLQIGFLHRPFGNFGQNQFNKGQFFISGAGLKYQPSENFRLQVEFSQRPGSYYYSPYSPYSSFGQSYRHPWQQQKEDNHR